MDTRAVEGASFPFTGYNGYTLHTRAFALPEEEQRGMFVFLHGLGSHCERRAFHHLARTMQKDCISTFMFDQQGHGQSQGPKGVLDHAVFLEDALLFIRTVYQRFGTPSTPLWIGGMSMGGALALVLCHHVTTTNAFPLAGCFLSAPALQLTPMDSCLLPLLQCCCCCCSLSLTPTQPKPEDIWNDPDVIQEAKDDPLLAINQSIPIPVHSLLDLLQLITKAKSLSPKITCPLFVLHGEKDAAASYKGSVYLVEHAPSRGDLKELHLIPSAMHGVLDDLAFLGYETAVESALHAWIRATRE